MTLALVACSPSAFDRIKREAGQDAERDLAQRERDAAVGGEGRAAGTGSDAQRSAPRTSEPDHSPAAAGASAMRAGAGGIAPAAGAAAASQVAGAAGAAKAAGAGGASPVAGAAGAAKAAGAGGASPVAGAAGAAGATAGAPAPNCGDTTSDPKNCGRCGHDCSAASASVECRSSMCVRTCKRDFDDCNHDLDLGTGGDGCETSLTTLDHCGTCGQRCAKPANGVAACEAHACVNYTLEVGAASPVTPAVHGTPGAPVYDQMCAPGQVLVGLNAVATATVALGFAVVCAPVSLTGSADKPGLRFGEPVVNDKVVGGNWGMAPVDHMLRCPAGSAVNSVNGTLWRYVDERGTFPTDSIKLIILGCSEAAFDAMRRVVFSPSKTLQLGDQSDSVGSYSDPCPAGQVVTGFKGHSGEWLDSLQTHCSTLSLIGSSMGD